MGWVDMKVEPPSSEVPAGRGGAACVSIDGGGRRLLVHGGADRTPLAFNDWWLLELTETGGHWTKIAPAVNLTNKRKLLPRSGASLTYLAAADGGPGKVYLYGGQDPVQGAIFDELLCLDTRTWELTDVEFDRQQPQPPVRHSHVAGPYQKHGLILFGGAGLRGPLADVWLFDVEEHQWRCLSQELAAEECPEAREMAAGTMISDAGLLVHGGRGAEGGLLDDICIFDGRVGRWVLLQRTGVPRCAHTACNTAPAVTPPPATDSVSGSGEEAGAAGEAPEQAAQAEGTGGEAAAAASSAAAPQASNVLLYGGFTGEMVASDLLQLSFLRQQRSSGSHTLRAELRPVKAAAAAAVPPPRFAHGAAAMSTPESAQVVVFGGVNQTDDLADVWIWNV